MAARHLSFYSSGDNSPIDSNPLVPCAAGIRYIPKVQRPVLPPNLFDCPCRLGDSCSDIWCLYAGWNFGVRPCASVNISRVWGRHAPTRALRKLTRGEEVKSRMGRKFSKIENLWPRDGSCSPRQNQPSCSPRQNYPSCTRSHFVIQCSTKTPPAGYHHCGDSLPGVL